MGVAVTARRLAMVKHPCPTLCRGGDRKQRDGSGRASTRQVSTGAGRPQTYQVVPGLCFQPVQTTVQFSSVQFSTVRGKRSRVLSVSISLKSCSLLLRVRDRLRTFGHQRLAQRWGPRVLARPPGAPALHNLKRCEFFFFFQTIIPRTRVRCCENVGNRSIN